MAKHRRANPQETTQKNRRRDDSGHTTVSDAEFKRAHAATVRQYAKAFEMLAAYDRGECKLPDDR